MENDMEVLGSGNYISQQILICPVPPDLYDEVIHVIQQSALNRIKNNDDILGLIIDLSEVKIMDLSNMEAMENTLSMAKLLGVKGCLSGLRPALALAMIDMGYESKKMHVTVTVEQGIKLLHTSVNKERAQYREEACLDNDSNNTEETIESEESVDESKVFNESNLDGQVNDETL